MSPERYIEQCKELGVSRGNLEEGKNIDRIQMHGKGHELEYFSHNSRKRPTPEAEVYNVMGIPSPS